MGKPDEAQPVEQPFELLDVDPYEDLPSILIVGDSGTHKTFFTASCPKPFVYDTDKGMRVTRGMDVEYETFKDAPKGARALKSGGIYPWGKGYPALLNRINEHGVLIDKGEFPHFTMGIDSLTTLSNICLNHVLKEDAATSLQPHVGQWGSQMRLLEVLMDQLTAWPVILVVTAHVQRNTNDVTQEIERLPLVTGKLAGKIGVYFNEVWYTEAKGSGDTRRFSLVTESSGLHKQAKTHSGIPNGTEPTWDAVAPYFFPDGLKARVAGEVVTLSKPRK